MTREEKIKAIRDYCTRQKYDYDAGKCVCPLRNDTFFCKKYSPEDAPPEVLSAWCNAITKEDDEKVDHPAHYQGKHECIDEMVALFGVDAVIGFCKCNVHKYRFRASAKNGQEDRDKADWYIDKLIELEARKWAVVRFTGEKEKRASTAKVESSSNS